MASKTEVFSGKQLHALLLTESYWETTTAASALYARLIEKRAWSEKRKIAFIKAFHTFLTNTKIIIKTQNPKLVEAIEAKFRKTEFRNADDMRQLISLWEQYSEEVQESPLMEIIKSTVVMLDE